MRNGMNVTFYFNTTGVRDKTRVSGGINRLEDNLKANFPELEIKKSGGARVLTSADCNYQSMNLSGPSLEPLVYLNILGRMDIRPDSLSHRNSDDDIIAEKILKDIYGDRARLKNVFSANNLNKVLTREKLIYYGIIDFFSRYY